VLPSSIGALALVLLTHGVLMQGKVTSAISLSCSAPARS
jgi:hypothetical protein